MISIPRAFSSNYAQARIKFLEAAAAAAAAGLSVQSHAHPLKGRDGEDLATDVARDGPMDAPNLLIISSACHGVEGFCAAACRCMRCTMRSGLKKPERQGQLCCTSTRSTRMALHTFAALRMKTWI